MSPETQQLRTWMQERFDRLEDQADKQAGELRDQATEIRNDLISTRHGQREIMEQITRQVVIVQEAVHVHATDIKQLKERERISEGWRNRMVGSVGILAVLFPATVAVILKYG